VVPSRRERWMWHQVWVERCHPAHTIHSADTKLRDSTDNSLHRGMYCFN
jgi:hypothetical protein